MSLLHPYYSTLSTYDIKHLRAFLHTSDALLGKNVHFRTRTFKSLKTFRCTFRFFPAYNRLTCTYSGIELLSSNEVSSFLKYCGISEIDEFVRNFMLKPNFVKNHASIDLYVHLLDLTSGSLPAFFDI